ncbi:unnamed protein product [Paramecium sonneborni]|uniref:Tubby C-terminal domain-containing protein n=1 Tax=Paramecium sonneborni TaxID=65129 RepID=A0A8S1K5I9_9CILI|nr:unnamed protein product [Paramecium sonneborni]
MKQQIDLKLLQQQREERFQKSLFGAPQVDQQIEDKPANSKVPQLSNENFVQIYVKCTITPEFVAQKELRDDNVDNEIDIVFDDVIENEELGMKKEYNVFVERQLVQQIKLLKQNYIEKQDLIKMPVCGSNGIRLPEEQDLLLYFEFFKIRENQTECQLLIQQQDLKNQYGLLICGCLFNDEIAQDLAFKFLTKKPTLEIIMKLLLVTVHYESKYQMYMYKLVKQILYYYNGILKEITDPLLTEVVQNLKQLQIEKPNIIRVNNKNFSLKINTTFLYPLYKQYEKDRGQVFKPINEYTQFSVLRNADIPDQTEESEYPHIYIIKKQSDQQQYLYGIQLEAHAEIHIYDNKCEKYQKYNDSYLGCVERNIWGTSMVVYDDGYPESLQSQFPDWIGQKRRRLMKIEYETNIMANEPRYFDTVFLNLDTKSWEELITLRPHYNQEKDCYQLNFFGRAKIASARNFQLIKAGDDKTIQLLHGKMEPNSFNLDFRPPLSILQAFAISMVSISSKALVS